MRDMFLDVGQFLLAVVIFRLFITIYLAPVVLVVYLIARFA